MATLGALRHPWHPLLHPYRTHDLCPGDLCRLNEFRRLNLTCFSCEESASAPAYGPAKNGDLIPIVLSRSGPFLRESHNRGRLGRLPRYYRFVKRLRAASARDYQSPGVGNRKLDDSPAVGPSSPEAVTA